MLTEHSLDYLRAAMKKILIVEDNSNFRGTLKGMLQQRFPTVCFEEAKEGTEALNKLTSFSPDLIFMDIGLPGQNGLVLTKEIKESYPEAAVIILTNYDLPEYREAARLSGADYFFSKGSSGTQEILTIVEYIIMRNKTEQSID